MLSPNPVSSTPIPGTSALTSATPATPQPSQQSASESHPSQSVSAVQGDPTEPSEDVKMASNDEDQEVRDFDAPDANDGAEDNETLPEKAVVVPGGDASDPSGRGLEGAADRSVPEPRIPVKKDITLREFLSKMDDYAPIIPDAVTNYYLTLAGLPPPPQTPPHLCRLLALAAQKFIADVAADAYQYARIRTGHTTSNTAAANAAAGVGVGMPGMDAAGLGIGGAAGVAGAGAGGKGKESEKAGKGVQLGVQRPGYGGGGQGGQGQGRTVLTMEDLGMAVGEYGVHVKRGDFYR